MKQVMQSLKTGVTTIEDVPVPKVGPGEILIHSTTTLVSAGTERMLIDFGKANIVNKARQQPDKVKMVLQKIRNDGVYSTFEAVQNKLDQPIPLGYCNVGKIIGLGKDVTGFTLGERVVSNGYHAEIVSVPKNLCCKIPDEVSDDEAVFTVLGAVAIQAIRLTAPQIGETIVVIGLGLVGLLTSQLLKAQGCRVLGIDLIAENLELAEKLGIATCDASGEENIVERGLQFSRGRGVDGVIVATATRSEDPIRQAAQMCRKRGRVTLVGTAGLKLSRDDFYEKELKFQVACSYGPGRYDPVYEQNGIDYPIGYVRWTEQRNFEAVLDMLALRNISAACLISHTFSIYKAVEAYDLLSSGTRSLGILIKYNEPVAEDMPHEIAIPQKHLRDIKSETTISNSLSFIGAGNYASGILLPAFKSARANFRTIASRNGITGVYCAKKFGFQKHTTDPLSIINDGATSAIVIATRHDSHAYYVEKSLSAGKNVFVEKPLCLTLGELSNLENIYKDLTPKPILMVGFNRRFSIYTKKIRELLKNENNPKAFVYSVNAGKISPDHWTQDLKIGGGRLVGEACHFIDLIRFIVGHEIVNCEVTNMDSVSIDTFSISLKFEDGSIGIINYFCNGSRLLPKERLEIFSNSKVLQLDNWRKLRGFGWKNFNSYTTLRQDKGQRECAQSFVKAVRNKCSNLAPIPTNELFEIARVSIQLANKLYD